MADITIHDVDDETISYLTAIAKASNQDVSSVIKVLMQLHTQGLTGLPPHRSMNPPQQPANMGGGDWLYALFHGPGTEDLDGLDLPERNPPRDRELFE